MAETTIEWADFTFNPWIGCTKVSPGCDHCYAEARDLRFENGVHWGPGAPRRRTSAANWRKPLKWNADAGRFYAEHGRRQRVFCASLADVFDNAVDPAWRRDLFDLIWSTPHLDWLLLTKRIGNVASMVGDHCGSGMHRLPSNVWLGATVVNQAEADRDIPKLLAVPATVRFLSVEPMLGPINLRSLSLPDDTESNCTNLTLDALTGCHQGTAPPAFVTDKRSLPPIREPLNWIIVGGESGPGARPMHPDWVRGLRDQCEAAGVPFLFKQWGEWGPNVVRMMLDGKRAGELVGSTIVSSTDRKQVGARVFYAMPADAKSEPGPVERMDRIGKKAAGRKLDGRTHDDFPSPTDTGVPLAIPPRGDGL